jgi:hydrogenase expression/formation protein HypC
MCVGVPGQVLSVDGMEAIVDVLGVRRTVRLDIVDEPVEAGDYVLSHVGFAVQRVPAPEARATLAIFDAILRDAGERPAEIPEA